MHAESVNETQNAKVNVFRFVEAHLQRALRTREIQIIDAEYDAGALALSSKCQEKIVQELRCSNESVAREYGLIDLT